MSNTFGCTNITKNYSDAFSLHDISLSITKGECLGVIGRNGSGKSTLLSILAGVNDPNSGYVTCNGNPITKQQRLKISYVPQTPILVDYLSVKDNLKLWCGIYNRKLDHTLLQTLPPSLQIDSMYRKKVSSLSGGMQKKISIAIALLNDPDFIIMDEAFAALDTQTISELIFYFKNQTTIGIVYSSHNASEILAVCNRIVCMENGFMTYVSNETETLDEAFIRSIYPEF